MSEENTLRFEAMGLRPELLQALTELNFERPTPIQKESIPWLLSSPKDLLAFAQTGTGKTAAFSLPILQQIDASQRYVQALILCPTRELCMQITSDIHAFSKHLNGVNAVAIYGGNSLYDQIKKLHAGSQIVVGTPGRVKDLMNRGKLSLDRVQWLVLDEADDMLDKGFKEDLDEILDETPREKQTLLFSATMSPWIRKVADQKMHDPKEIRMASQNQGADTVEHLYVTVHAKDRYAALRRLLDVNPDVYGIVFCRTRRDTKEVAAKLIADNYSAEAIHGDISQNERSDAMQRFRNKHIQILVATDVAARGIDVNDLTHVINYELPDTGETYVHRSGRTGRAGKTGIALTIINMKERGKIRDISRMMKKEFKEMDVPTGKEICEAQLMSLVNRVKDTEVNETQLEPYMDSIYEALYGMSTGDLIKKFISVEFNRFLKHYSKVTDISTLPHAHEERGGSRRGKANMAMRSYRLNVGKQNGFGPKTFFQMLNNNKSLKGIEIGSIRVDSRHTDFEADASYHEKLLRFLSKERVKGRPLKISSI